MDSSCRPLVVFILPISMLQISISGRSDNMTSHPSGYFRVSKSVDYWKDSLSLVVAHVRKNDIKAPV